MQIPDAAFDFDAFFCANYPRVARTVARIVGDLGRAEDLAAEAFWKLWRTPQAQGRSASGWVYRTAVRMALNDLRQNRRRAHYESQSDHGSAAPTPEQVHAAAEEQRRVRAVLAALDARQAELLMLRASGLSYDQTATALGLNPASVGTLLSRAQQAFRKEYLKQNGEPKSGR